MTASHNQCQPRAASLRHFALGAGIAAASMTGTALFIYFWIRGI